MCTEANDLLKFRMDYIYQIRITFLTAVFFETGAMPTPTKSQNPNNCD